MANTVSPFAFRTFLKILHSYRKEVLLTSVALLAVGHMAVAEVVIQKEPTLDEVKAIALKIDAMQNVLRPYGRLPKAGRRWTIRIPITAYSSEPWQTDDTPLITASGTHVRDGIVAANFLPIGTRVRIPELYGKKEFIVEDRMNARYHHKMDIWMEETPAARRFGMKFAEVEVLPN